MIGSLLRLSRERRHAVVATSAEPSAARWLGIVAALALVEVFLTSLAFNVPTDLPEWLNPIAYVKRLAHVGVLTVLAFLVIAWPTSDRILALWREAAQARRWTVSVGINLALFVALLLASAAFSSRASDAGGLPALWFAAYSGLLLATGVSLACVAAPPSFWRELLIRMPTEILLAALSACLVLLASELSKESWHALSRATLSLAYGMLTLYEANVVLDVERKLLGVGDFRVLILKECSGYEGAGLVIAFLALYIWIFRRELRFPNVLVLFPIGVAAVWILNSVRIAALVSVGAHISPAVAVDGFHSQAGWIGFLLVAIASMLISHQSRFFRATLEPGSRLSSAPSERLMLALLAPFMALMATSIVASAFAPNDQWLYALKVAGVCAALWWFRRAYTGLMSAVSPLSVLAGVGVGLAWVMTDPMAHANVPLGAWLATLSAPAAVAWIGLRALGSILLVPVAEELAFRGYLHRVLIWRRFECVAPGQFGWLAFVGSSLLFGLLHQRWVVGALAGAVFALVMYRTNRLSDPIAAHMTANAVIMAWAVAAAQWSLL
jgi:exosortase E/protease (VPEID-CTERM system)